MRLFEILLNPASWRGLWTEFQLGYRLLRDRRVPLTVKLIPIGALLYVISPFDLIPGVIPVIGQLDDLAILIIGLRMFIRSVSPEIIRDYNSV